MTNFNKFIIVLLVAVILLGLYSAYNKGVFEAFTDNDVLQSRIGNYFYKINQLFDKIQIYIEEYKTICDEPEDLNNIVEIIISMVLSENIYNKQYSINVLKKIMSKINCGGAIKSSENTDFLNYIYKDRVTVDEGEVKLDKLNQRMYKMPRTVWNNEKQKYEKINNKIQDGEVSDDVYQTIGENRRQVQEGFTPNKKKSINDNLNYLRKHIRYIDNNFDQIEKFNSDLLNTNTPYSSDTIASNFKDNSKRCKEIICNILQTLIEIFEILNEIYKNKAIEQNIDNKKEKTNSSVRSDIYHGGDIFMKRYNNGTGLVNNFIEDVSDEDIKKSLTSERRFYDHYDNTFNYSTDNKCPIGCGLMEGKHGTRLACENPTSSPDSCNSAVSCYGCSLDDLRE